MSSVFISRSIYFMEKKYFIEYIASSKRIQMREILKY